MNGMGRDAVARVGAGVVGATLVVTASFVGLLALVTGDVAALGDRLPLYVLAMAVAFVATLLLVEHRRHGPAARATGRDVLATAGGIALATFAVVTLSGEGLLYAATNPTTLLASQIVLYFLAGGLVATGLGYWAIQHWREFA